MGPLLGVLIKILVYIIKAKNILFPEPYPNLIFKM